MQLTEFQQGHLRRAFEKLRTGTWMRRDVILYEFEADALYAEFCRLANFATLLGEPSPAEMAGIFTRQEADAIAADFLSRGRDAMPEAFGGSVGSERKED